MLGEASGIRSNRERGQGRGRCARRAADRGRVLASTADAHACAHAPSRMRQEEALPTLHIRNEGPRVDAWKTRIGRDRSL